MRLFAGVLFTLAASQGAARAPVEDKYLETIKVSDRVYVFKPKIDWVHGNGVAILGPDGVFFIDTYIQFNYAEEAIRRLRKITKLPVRYVLNTHWHNDHVTGNGVFKQAFPHCQFIAHDSTAAYLERIVKPAVDSESISFDRALAALVKQAADVKLGPGGTRFGSSLKPYLETLVGETRAYRREFRAAPFVNADITFSDSLTMRWGNQTLRLIHVGKSAHSEGDVVVWIPEQRLLVAGDLVVGPTPYATQDNSANMASAIHELIAMKPSVVVPGHGPVLHDLSYMKLLERAFTEYRAATEAAIARKMPVRQALDSIAFPDIDHAFTGGDSLRMWAYQTFFVRNIIVRSYRTAGAIP